MQKLRKVFSQTEVKTKCATLFAEAMLSLLDARQRAFAHLKAPQNLLVHSKCQAANVSSWIVGWIVGQVVRSRAAMLILSIKFNSLDYFGSIRLIRNDQKRVCDSNPGRLSETKSLFKQKVSLNSVANGLSSEENRMSKLDTSMDTNGSPTLTTIFATAYSRL